VPDTIDRFLPRADIAEDHAITVRAPAALVFEVAEGLELESIPLVRALFRLRAILMGSTAPVAPRAGLAAMTRAIGWGELARTPGRELVCGAVTQPWLADVAFRAVPAERFLEFAEPGLVKIVWTLEAEPRGDAATRFRSRTRALATDDDARRRFARYWRWARFGIVGIRWLLLPAVRREAERRYRARGARGILTPP